MILVWLLSWFPPPKMVNGSLILLSFLKKLPSIKLVTSYSINEGLIVPFTS